MSLETPETRAEMVEAIMLAGSRDFYGSGPRASTRHLRDRDPDLFAAALPEALRRLEARRGYWRRRSAREARDHSLKGRACAHCGEPLDVEARADARFCGSACRVRALRAARRTRGVDG